MQEPMSSSYRTKIFIGPDFRIARTIYVTRNSNSAVTMASGSSQAAPDEKGWRKKVKEYDRMVAERAPAGLSKAERKAVAALVLLKHQSEENIMNRRQYMGARVKGSGAWVSEIRPSPGIGGRAAGGNSRVWLGSYTTAAKAARAHDIGVFLYRSDPREEQFNYPQTKIEVEKTFPMANDWTWEERVAQQKLLCARIKNPDP